MCLGRHIFAPTRQVAASKGWTGTATVTRVTLFITSFRETQLCASALRSAACGITSRRHAGWFLCLRHYSRRWLSRQSPAEGGVVYFSYTGGLWSMSGNGGFGKTQLNMEGNPSERTYGGRRWFLQRRSPADGVVETWAVRDDGAEQLLPVDMDLETTFWWGPGDVLVGIGRRWMLDGNVDPTSCGVYLADIEFDAAGDIVSYVPPALYAPLDVIVDDEGQAQVDIRWGCDISPDLTRLVQTRVSGPGLWVTDLLTGDSQQITTEGPASRSGRPRATSLPSSLPWRRTAVSRPSTSMAPTGTRWCGRLGVSGCRLSDGLPAAATLRITQRPKNSPRTFPTRSTASPSPAATK